MIPEGMMCNVFSILYVLFTGTKVNGVRAKIRQRIISHEKSEVFVSLPLFAFQELTFAPLTRTISMDNTKYLSILAHLKKRRSKIS